MFRVQPPGIELGKKLLDKFFYRSAHKLKKIGSYTTSCRIDFNWYWLLHDTLLCILRPDVQLLSETIFSLNVSIPNIFKSLGKSHIFIVISLKFRIQNISNLDLNTLKMKETKTRLKYPFCIFIKNITFSIYHTWTKEVKGIKKFKLKLYTK